ncbi:6977_t:CDS:1 [Entrophospora sp. SA101]|nr:6977_t:CDS:1 [Entrophospora sp. SA101]
MQSSILLLITIALSICSFLQSVDALNERTKSQDVCKNAKVLENGEQIRGGSCSVTVQGEIPNENSMVSTTIFFPPNGGVIQAKKTFTIVTKTINLNTGFFSDPAKEYYIFPQTLGKNGLIQGHSHVTVQKFENGQQILDPKKFAFFKGLNNNAKVNGELNLEVPGGLDVGSYRLCTMVSSFTHQPVLMPVAQRGAQDDCVRFKVANQGKKKRSLKKRYVN